MSPHTLHVISQTHWDREWRHSFQRMRMDLVEMMDRLLDICETEPSFRHFHLDSQTICIEDYLEIRPERREALARFVTEGRITAGPWYTLPDMFLVSGESVVRNIMLRPPHRRRLGRRRQDRLLTNVLRPDLPDSPDLPGFGIDHIIFYRGIDYHGIKQSEYILEGADGSRLLGVKLSDMTRYNFRFNVFSATIHPEGDWKILMHPCDTESFRDTYRWMHDQFLGTWKTDDIKDGIRRTKEDLLKRSTTEHLLMMDGFDASYPHANSGLICRDAEKKGWLDPGDKIVHTTFAKFFETISKAVDWDKLKVVKAESRVPARDTMGSSTMPGILTSHMYLKLANHDAQTLLEKRAEPMCAAAWMLGCEYPRTYLDIAWKHLLANHPHDTICGASVDRIYPDAMNRYEQSRQIAHNMTNLAEFEVLGKSTRRDRAAKDQLFTVFNSVPYERTEVAEAFVEFPREDKVDQFALTDAAGRAVPFVIKGREKLYGVSESGDALYQAYFVDRYLIQFTAKDIPSVGYKHYRAKAGKKPAEPKRAVTARGNTMENEFLKVAFAPNGTLTLTDKKTKRLTKGLHYFEDGADAGDPWHFKRPTGKDNIVNTLKGKASVKKVEDTPLACAFEVSLTLKAPAALVPDKTRRTREMKAIRIASTVRLAAGSRRLEFTTRIDSPVRDHRLRAMFPTGVQTDTAHAEGSFDVVQRSLKRPENTQDWVDREVGIQPQQSFVDLSDGKSGIALLNRGLREYEVLDDAQRTLAVTLVRGIRYPSIAGGAQPFADDPYQDACQCTGAIEHHYALMPHAGNWEKGRVLPEARLFNVPLRMAQCSAGVATPVPEFSFLRLEGDDLVLSAMKVADREDALVVRVYNPTTRTARGAVVLANAVASARTANLNEEPQGSVPVTGGNRVELELAPKKIVTLLLKVKPLD